MKLRSTLARTALRRLRLLLVLVLVLLAAPATVLVLATVERLQNEARLLQQQAARDLMRAIDTRWQEWLEREADRSVGAYEFVSVGGDLQNNYLAPSALSVAPEALDLPGAVGYFQIGVDGELTSPHLPPTSAIAQRWGLSMEQFEARRQILKQLFSILNRNQLVAGSTLETAPATPPQPAPALAERSTEQGRSQAEPVAPSRSTPKAAGATAQAAFDRLEQRKVADLADRRQAFGKVEEQEADVMLEESLAASSPEPTERRTEQTYQADLDDAPSADRELGSSVQAPPRLIVNAFESEVEAFNAALLDSGELVLFRRVWTDAGRLIQGVLLEPVTFFETLVRPLYANSPLAGGFVEIDYAGRALTSMETVGERSYLARASGPLATLDRIPFSPPLELTGVTLHTGAPPMPTGAGLVVGSVIALCVVLLVTLGVLYRAGRRQIELAEQQRDFVASVSHELKTPLTSIRMYSEILKAGWADEDRRRGYYDFIFDESERLSRLINNVLRLARVTHQGNGPELQVVSAAQVAAMIESRARSALDAAGFELELRASADLHGQVEVDEDQLAQIVVNLVDNAVKFSRDADRKVVTVSVDVVEDRLNIKVRDYGPGIPRGQLKKIFRLFYRVESELTRETVGTGIGLALVHELVTSMGGRIDCSNRNPGAEFGVSLPLVRG